MFEQDRDWINGDPCKTLPSFPYHSCHASQQRRCSLVMTPALVGLLPACQGRQPSAASITCGLSVKTEPDRDYSDESRIRRHALSREA
jgi:hypothetical protein|eukprot:SAG25_NODE_1127_length_3875_cov_3.733316_3_plen_88_part_00